MDSEHPASFRCPILREFMCDPVILPDGHSYERQAIEKWLEEQDTSPLTGSKLARKEMIPNHALRSAMAEYFQRDLKRLRKCVRRRLSFATTPDAEEEDSGKCVRRRRISFAEEEEGEGSLVEAVGSLVQTSLSMHSEGAERGLAQVMEEAKSLLGAAAASVFLVDFQDGMLMSQVNSTGSELRIPIASSIAGHVATTGEPLLVRDAHADSRFNGETDKRTGFTTKNMIIAPLKDTRGIVLGVVQLINKTRGVTSDADGCFTGADLHFLQIFASEAAAAVERSGEFLDSAAIFSSEQQGIFASERSGEFVHSYASCIVKGEDEDDVPEWRLERLDTPEFWPDDDVCDAQICMSWSSAGPETQSWSSQFLAGSAPLASDSAADEQKEPVGLSRWAARAATQSWSSQLVPTGSLGCSSAATADSSAGERKAAASLGPDPTHSWSSTFAAGSFGCSSAPISDPGAEELAETAGRSRLPAGFAGCSSARLSDFAPDAEQSEDPKSKRESGRTRQRRAHAKRKQLDSRDS